MKHIKAQGSVNPVANGKVKRYAKASTDDNEKFEKVMEKAKWIIDEEEDEEDEGSEN